MNKTMMKKSRFAIVIMALMITSTVSAQDFDKKNLLYRINSTENKTVELLGFEKKPKEELVIPDEVSYKGDKYAITTIAENAFKDCIVLKSIIGSTIQTIKDGAFQGCINLSSVTFSDQLSEVKNNVFRGCTSLSQVSLGDNVQTIGDAAFAACASLSELSFGSGLRSLGTGVMNGTKISSIVLPNSLVKVGHHAFADCNQLSSVTFGNALIQIDDNAFEKTSISTIVFPNTLLIIGDKAFADCTNLQSITYGNSLKEIGAGAFQGIPISSLSFPTSLLIVKDGAFKDCKSLQNISFNDNIESIKENAFKGCSLLSVDLTDCMADVANNAFEGCNSVITSNYSIKGIANYINKLENNVIAIPDLNREQIDHFIHENDVVVLGDFKDGFAFFQYTDKGISKCDVVTIFGKVISQKGGYVVAENLIMVPSDNGNGVVLKDIRGKILSKSVYDDIYKNNKNLKFTNGYLQVCKNKKYGFIDKSGKEVVPCKYSRVNDFEYGVAVVCGDTDDRVGAWKKGLINTKGQEVIPCDKVREGLAGNESGEYIVKKNSKYGVIDKDLNIIIPFEYDDIYGFSEGLASVIKNGKLGFIDKANRLIIPYEYDCPDLSFSGAPYFSEGLVAIKKDGKWGYINKSNKVVIPFIYDIADDFHGGLAIVTNDDVDHQCIDMTGKIIQPSWCEYVNDGIYRTSNEYGQEFVLFNKYGIIGKFDTSWNNAGVEYYDGEKFDGYLFVGRNNKSGVIDYNGKEIIPIIYELINHCDYPNHQFIIAKSGSSKTLFDTSGNMIVSPDYEIKSSAESIVKVRKDDLYGYIDKSGKIVSPCIYDEAEDFHNGFAIVCKGGLWGVIDKSGKETIPCKYQGVSFFYDGLAFVNKDGKWGFVDLNGKSTFDYQK